MRIHFFKTTIRNLEKELKKAQSLNNLRLFKIAKALLMIADGKSLNEISELMHISSRQIFNWLKRFMAESFSWLVGLHYQGRGRKSKLTKTQRKRLYDMICDGPEKCGYDCGV